MTFELGDCRQMGGRRKVFFDCFGRCVGCGLGVLFRLERNLRAQANQPHDIAGLVNDQFDLIDSYPRAVDGKAPAHTPSNVAKHYEEAMKAFNVGAWTPAAMGFRKVVDVATLNLDSTLQSKQTFVARINALRDASRLSQALADMADVVRLDGNEAAHEPESFEETDTKELQKFTELFLQYVFTLEAEVKLALAHHTGTPSSI